MITHFAAVVRQLVSRYLGRVWSPAGWQLAWYAELGAWAPVAPSP